MSATPEINRENAQLSTGPKTESGKQRSALNALRHGLTSQIVVMATEDLAAYQRLLKSFHDEYHPKGATEAELVQSLADASWRLNRVAALEANLLTLAAAQAHFPLTEAPTQIQEAMALASCLEAQSKALTNLSLHSQRLARQFERTVVQLRDLQSIRHAHERAALNDLMDIMEMHKSKGRTYHPSEDGFVFSQSEIDRALILRQRDRQARIAYNSASA